MTTLNRAIVGFLVIFLFSCNPYRQVTTSDDVFLSHKIWKENYDKYVYLVDDGNSVYSLDSVKLIQDANLDSVVSITGTLNEYVDTAVNPNKWKQKKEDRKKVLLKLEDGALGQNKPGEKVELKKEGIKEVTYHAKKNTGIVGTFFKVVGIIIGIFVLLIIVIIVAALSSDSGGGGGSNSNSNSDPQCYIATMAYGTPDAPEVLKLRGFRDRVLLKNRAGQSFVKWYYKTSPKLVERYRNNPRVNQFVRFVLDRLVAFIKP
ncbi:MAG: hypothetical protein JJ975_06125 [Bacteroidia bacterium]|nr:hypothetical protein [Bacteroidia bacterium]